MNEGKVLGSILSLILYGDKVLLWELTTFPGEFRNHSARGLSRNRADLGHPIKVQTGHPGISA